MSHLRARTVAFLALFAACACNVASGGLGIGLPDVDGRAAEGRLPLAFTRAYLPDGPDAAGLRYVELVNAGNVALDLRQEPLALVGAGGAVPLPSGTWAAGATLQVTGAALAPLGLHRHLGEVGVLDANASLQAYAAWGGEGLALPFGLGEMARQSGLATAGAAPLAFPLAAGQAVLLTGAAGGACTAADANAAPPFAAAACAAANVAPPKLLRLVPAGVDDAGASFTLYNPDPQAWLDPYGLWACTTSAGCRRITYGAQDANGPAFLAPAPAGGLAADPIQADARRRLVAAGATATAQTDLQTSLPPLRSGDELCLLPPSSDPNGTAPDALDYVRLAVDRGAQGNVASPLAARVKDADARAAWARAAAPVPRLSGEATVRALDAPATAVGPAAWRLAADVAEDAATAPLTRWADPYTACSAPDAPAPATVQLSQLAVLAPDQVRVVLRRAALDANAPDAAATPEAAAAEPFEGVTLLLGGASYALPASPTASTEYWLGVTSGAACQPPFDACWAGAPAALLAGGEASLQRGGALLAHVQWGAASLPSARGAAAADAGVWPGPGCREAGFSGNEAGVSLQLRLPRPGQGPADYVVGP